jgi:mRNA interferase MazF
MKRGKVVLAPFQFTDLSGRKVRPAVVVSRSDRSGSDVLLAFITSYRGQPLTRADLAIESTYPDFALTGLKFSSVLRLDKLVTVDTAIVLGELGELSTALLRQVDDRLRYALDL